MGRVSYARQWKANRQAFNKADVIAFRSLCKSALGRRSRSTTKKTPLGYAFAAQLVVTWVYPNTSRSIHASRHAFQEHPYNRCQFSNDIPRSIRIGIGADACSVSLPEFAFPPIAENCTSNHTNTVLPSLRARRDKNRDFYAIDGSKGIRKLADGSRADVAP